MQVYTFDFICECQDFNHNEEFVLKKYLDSEMESKQKEITALEAREKKLVELVKTVAAYPLSLDEWDNVASGSALLGLDFNELLELLSGNAREVLKELGVE